MVNYEGQQQSKFFEVLLKLHLLLLDESRLIDLVGGVHGQFSLEDVEHVVSCGVNHSVVAVHKFLHHLSVDEHVIHGLLEVLEITRHDFEVGVVGVSEHIGHLIEASHDSLVVLESLHVSTDKLHFQAHSLNVHC